MDARCSLIIGLLIIIAPPSFCDSISPPYSYREETPDKRHVFIMISEQEGRKYFGYKQFQQDLKDDPHSDSFGGAPAPFGNPFSKESIDILEAYSQSGLYQNNGSTNPLWTVDWYAYDVKPLSDAVHLVRPGPWASAYNDPAVSFYKNGSLLRTHTVNELVADPKSLPHSVSHFEWRKETKLDDDKKRYRIVTLSGERYRFNVTTGRIKAAFKPRHAVLAIVLLVIALAAMTILFITRKK